MGQPYARYDPPVVIRDPRADNASKYDPRFCDEVRFMASQGWFFHEWCAHLGVTRATVYNWADKYPEFDQACQEAFYALSAYWHREAREAKGGYPGARPPAITMEILRKKFPRHWGTVSADDEGEFMRRNTHNPETGPAEAKPLADHTDEELNRRIAELEARRKVQETK